LAHLPRRSALKRALDACERRGIAVMVVKGMALASLVYPDPALRPMADVDLWVRPADLDAADAALRDTGLGYPARTHAGRQLPTAAEGLAERSFELPDTLVLFELHGTLKSLAALDAARIERIWTRSRPATLGGIPARVQHPEDLLLHLCLHAAAAHRFTLGLGPLVDIQRVVARWQNDFDWPAMAADWKQSGVAAWMGLTLLLARDLFGAPVPTTVLGRLAGYDELTRLATIQLWARERPLPHALERLAGPAGRTAIRDRLRVYGERPPGAGWWTYASLVARRVAHDLTVKVPRYARQWLDGTLRGATRRRRTALARERHRLGELVARAEAALQEDR
jgi:hypothetical protein